MVANSSSSVEQPLCHDSESSTLLQFKQSFLIDEDASDDPSAYPKVTIWKSQGEGEGEGEESDCCSWDGVECDRKTGHVIDLHLSSSCLYGSINSSSTLFSLVHLKRLDLSDNDFNYSEIPFGVGQLSRLRSLNLADSRFSGQIPSELLALSKLVFLELKGNPMLQLQKPGLRNLVENLTHLKTLHLSYVNMSSTIPHALANLSSLTSLALRECRLHGEFPVTIFQLPSLQYLSVRYNPDLIGYLPEFQEISPSKMLYLKQDEVEVLSLFNNKIHGPIPKWMWNISKETLGSLDLSQNSLTGFDQPPVVLPWSRLKSLQLDSNMLQGPLPIPPPSTFEYSVFGNKLTGEISPLICNMSSLMLLDLCSNNLSGMILLCLANFSKSLFVLDLGSNSLDGSIPQTCTMSNNLRVKVNDMTSLPVTLNTIPRAAITSFSMGFPHCNLWISRRITRSMLINQKALLELKQGRALTIMAQWLLHRRGRQPSRPPQGNQFATFPNASFDGNPGLCGSPLSRACGSSETSPPTPSSSKQGSTSEFDWKIVLMGYGSGLVIGVSIGYCLTSWKHEWFVKTFGKQQRKWTRRERRGHRG
ncbi:hypothetical protein PVL29_015655 [Vitis rotundifolia]|uniref:Leucine-rich repeat-containing N-terminal plant-type domain-containing protein n=1 Tax=Vitis rotundifolia TaxID=103349 RepID=A0AA38ZD92_VITRO|nr:hypothetical protein PVL29_015655 [Vitis rotundifolia]